MKPVKVIAVTGGKGGVGKTSISLNLGVALAQSGKKVMIFDADLGLANIDVMLGLSLRRNLLHVLRGECELKDIIATGPAGVRIVPASSGAQQLVDLNSKENAGLIQAFSSISEDLDFLLIDTAAGISSTVVSFTQAAQDILFVVCDEPTSIADTYALMKILSTKHGIHRFRVAANMARSLKEGKSIFSKLTSVTDKFLDVSIDFSAIIPFDDNVRLAIKKQKALIEAFPKSPASIAIKTLANKIIDWRMPEHARGNIEFFMERLITHAV